VVKFSLVVPIKDEIDLLPLTLPSYYALNPDEVIFCLDHPKSPEIVKKISLLAKKYNALDKTRIIGVKKNSNYRFHQAIVRRTGFKEAKNDIILTGDIDTIFHLSIRDHIDLVGQGNIKLVSFSKFSYPISFRKSVIWLIHKFYPHESFTGLYAFSKSTWLETEDMKSLKKIPRGEDTHLHIYLTKRYNSKFISGVKNIVLRPFESRKYLFLCGWTQWVQRKTPLWRVLISTVLYFRPYWLFGYLKARIMNITTIRD
jgi:hypothetical protein